MRIIITILITFFYLNVFCQCPTPNGLFTTNITSTNALANWIPVIGADHYKIHYRIYGTAVWSNLGNINSNDSSRNLPLLQQGTCYEWEIMSFCDSTNLLGSSWSVKDTFTTALFIPAPFNPNINYILSNLQCDQTTEFLFRITQDANEPDIGECIINSSNGAVNLNYINIGDSVGHTTLITSSQTINTVLKFGGIISPDLFEINSFTTTGILLNSFNIENINGGVKISSTSPNDGNNYTNGFISDVHFTNLFVNPPESGPLYFFANINSELNDQIIDTNFVQIWCPQTEIKETLESKKPVNIFNLSGGATTIKKNMPLLYRYQDGLIIKKIILE